MKQEHKEIMELNHILIVTKIYQFVTKLFSLIPGTRDFSQLSSCHHKYKINM